MKGKGQYVGTYLAWRVKRQLLVGVKGKSSSTWTVTRNTRLSAEPGLRTTSAARTISRTRRRASTRSSPPPYAGMHQVIRPDGCTCGDRFGCTAGISLDPVRFSDKDLKVTIQDLGWRHDGRYNNQKSDICRPLSGTRPSCMPNSWLCRARTIWKFQDGKIGYT